MSKEKINYGIDLGLTSSAIAVFEDGDARIIKSDTLKNTISSCVGISKRGIVVGDQATNILAKEIWRVVNGKSPQASAFIEFRLAMGTDTLYHSEFSSKKFTPEELSAEVLKKLKTFTQDEALRSIVITVPAKFRLKQREATIRAANLAGFDDCRLLREPVAAAIAYGLDSQEKDGWAVVFDFSSRTFDVALLQIKRGSINIWDTEGDNSLGGKELDYAIVDEILIPHLRSTYRLSQCLANARSRESLRNALRLSAEQIKNQLSFVQSYSYINEPDELPHDDEGTEMEMDITVTRHGLAKAVGPVYQKAIDITKSVLERNNLTGSELQSFILVGGPTFSPVLRGMLKRQITSKIDTSIDPMTAVARGAAIFASTVDISESVVADKAQGKVQLKVDYEPTTPESFELITIKINEDQTTAKLPSEVFLEIVRGDKGWSSGSVNLSPKGVGIDVQLEEGKSNTFDINLFDSQGKVIRCEPSSINIFQGIRFGKAVLPYGIALGSYSSKKGYAIVKIINGLEKNKSLPATGTVKGLKTQQDMRPGVAADIIRIPIYEVEHGAEGSRLINNQHVFDVVLTGESLSVLLPRDSEIELTIRCPLDGSISASVYVPCLNLTENATIAIRHRKSFSVEEILEDLEKVARRIDRLDRTESSGDLKVVNSLRRSFQDLSELLAKDGRSVDTRMQIAEMIKGLRRNLDNVEDESKQSNQK